MIASTQSQSLGPCQFSVGIAKFALHSSRQVDLATALENSTAKGTGLDQRLNIADALHAMLGCTDAAAQAAARMFRRRQLVRGEALATQGATSERCWLVLDGFLALRAVGSAGQLVQVAVVGPGEFIGAFPRPRPQPADLVATIRSEVLETAAASLGLLAREEAGIGLGLASLLARQHDKLVAGMTRQFVLSAVGRVYAELLDLADSDGRICPSPVLAVVALRANTTRETASRAVGTAQRRGVIVRDDLELRIVSRSRLEGLII